MTTTALIVEMIIIGLQVGAWVIMLVLAFLGYQNVQAITNLSAWSTELLVLAIGTCYTLGIVFDAVASWIQDWALALMNKSGKAHANERCLRQKMRFDSPEVSRYIDDEEYRIRLLRATALNLMLIAATGTLLMYRLAQINPWQQMLLFAGASLAVALCGCYAWYRRFDRYMKNLRILYEIAERRFDQSASRNCDPARLKATPHETSLR